MVLQYWGLDADIVQVCHFDLWVRHKNNHSRWRQQSTVAGWDGGNQSLCRIWR